LSASSPDRPRRTDQIPPLNPDLRRRRRLCRRAGDRPAFSRRGIAEAKRKELSSLKAQLQTRLHVAVSETGHHELWQRATLTAALTAADLHHLSDAADAVQRFVASRMGDGASVQRLIVSVEDLRG
jgi:uncharacterized protein YlxP (DUF503 family)